MGLGDHALPAGVPAPRRGNVRLRTPPGVTMSPRFPRACTAVLMLALTACSAGTKLTNSWKAADAAPMTVKQGDLVIAMVMSKEETTRRTGEDLLGEELRQRGLRPIPSFTLIPTDQ